MPRPQLCSDCWALPCRCIETHPHPPPPPSRPPLPSKHSSTSSYTSFYSLTSLSPPSLASKLLSTLTAILTLGLYKPSRPKTRLTPFTRWRARRQSVKELRKEEAAVHEEYLKLRELDNRVMKAKPPSYGVVVGLGGEEVVSLGMGTRTSSSSTSGGSAVGTGRTTSENGLQMSGGGSAR